MIVIKIDGLFYCGDDVELSDSYDNAIEFNDILSANKCVESISDQWFFDFDPIIELINNS